jgi:ribosomal-protein-alanine N-acetyltransferase
MRILELKTTRAKLVIPTLEEADATLDYYVRNREHLRATEPRIPDHLFSVEFRRERLRENLVAFQADQSVRFFVELKEESGKFVGVVNFSNIVRGSFQACHLGYSIDATQQGKGLMFEALTEGIRYIFDEKQLHRIMANHLPENQRSANLLKRLGFEVEGHAKKYLFINGEWRDHALTSLVNPRWSPREQEKAMFDF